MCSESQWSVEIHHVRPLIVIYCDCYAIGLVSHSELTPPLPCLIMYAFLFAVTIYIFGLRCTHVHIDYSGYCFCCCGCRLMVNKKTARQVKSMCDCPWSVREVEITFAHFCSKRIVTPMQMLLLLLLLMDGNFSAFKRWPSTVCDNIQTRLNVLPYRVRACFVHVLARRFFFWSLLVNVVRVCIFASFYLLIHRHAVVLYICETRRNTIFRGIWPTILCCAVILHVNYGNNESFIFFFGTRVTWVFAIPLISCGCGQRQSRYDVQRLLLRFDVWVKVFQLFDDIENQLYICCTIQRYRCMPILHTHRSIIAKITHDYPTT